MIYAPQMGNERNVVSDPTVKTLYPHKESNELRSVEELSGRGGKESSKK